ncbi:MAG TPA: hypothetical protein VM492_14880 [Sumerlaeia bacterium]|nr:hypothetical protein [Sumerlaeia bacterium]
MGLTMIPRPVHAVTCDGEPNEYGMAADGRKDVRGGSCCDRPRRAHAAFRLARRPYRRVFNVGSGVACGGAVDEGPASPKTRKTAKSDSQ